MQLVLTLMPGGDTNLEQAVEHLTARRDEDRPPDPLGAQARAAQSGDQVALRELLDGLGPRLLRTVRGVLGARHPELDDTLQEAMLLFVRSLPAFRGEGDVTGYAVRITLRAAITARKRHRARATEAEVATSEGEAEAATQTDAVLAARRREILRRLLEDLPETQAEALGLRVVLGYSLAETAEISGCPENTIRSRIRLAREALKKRIETEGLLDVLEVNP